MAGLLTAIEDARRRLADAYARVRTATEAMFEAEARTAEARRGLAALEFDLLAQGDAGPVNGKNAEVRRAQLAAETLRERTALEAAEDALERARLEASLARLTLNEVRDAWRTVEAEVAVTGRALPPSEEA